MDEKTRQIIEMLIEGKSYTVIQSILHVSPSKISQINRDYATVISDHKIDGNSVNIEKIIDSSNESSSVEYRDTIDLHDKELMDLKSQLAKYKNLVNQGINDKETILQLKTIEFEHRRKIKQMEMEDRERERKYEQELKEAEIERQRLAVIKQRNDKIRDQFNADFEVFVNSLLECNGKECKRNNINEGLIEIKALKQRFQQICETDGDDYEEYSEWEILDEAQNYVSFLKKDLDRQIILPAVTFELSEDFREMLEDFLEE